MGSRRLARINVRPLLVVLLTGQVRARRDGQHYDEVELGTCLLGIKVPMKQEYACIKPDSILHFSRYKRSGVADVNNHRRDKITEKEPLDLNHVTTCLKGKVETRLHIRFQSRSAR